MIKLSDMLENINGDSEMNNLDVNDQIILQTYYFLAEILDKTNVYPYQSSGRFTASFTDNNNIQHFIRIVYQPLKSPRHDVKIGFIGKDGRPSYEKPNVHYNIHPDEKIFNTHIHILIDDFLNKSNFFEKSKSDKLYIPATDYPRYRLYRMALNKFLDKSLYNVVDDPNNKNTLIINYGKDRTRDKN